MDVRNKFVGLCYNPDFVSVYCALQGYQVNGISETIFLPLDLNPFRFKAHCVQTFLYFAPLVYM